MPFELRDEHIETFQRDGAICLRGVFDPEWVQKIANGIEKNKQAPSIYSENLKAPGSPGYYFNDYCNWEDIGEFRDFVYNSGAKEIAGRLMESEYAVFYHEHVLTKDPGTHRVTPWHQDQPYYPVDGFKNISLWMPIDFVPKRTCAQFIRGSHRWNKWFIPRKFATLKNYETRDADSLMLTKYEDIPDIDHNINEYDVLSWDVQPGDVVAFHMLCVHGAPANTTDIHRRVVSTRWLGDDCVFSSRPWEVSPPIDGGLKSGDKFVCDTFPIVWTKYKYKNSIN